ncbi:M20/M25/M40 family metallo-hydrolase [Geodermatophilus sp. SYSU D00815]
MPERGTRTTRRTAPRAVAVGAGGLLLAALLPAASAAAGGGNSCEHRTNNTYEKLLDCVTVEGVQEHLAALQKIADNSTDEHYPDSRAAGTDGYADSVEYVADLLRGAGYRVTLDPVEFPFAFPVVIRQLTPQETEHEGAPFAGGVPGAVEGPVVPVDINLEGERASTSGCEAGDFAGLPFGGPSDIALLQRGTCAFGVKVQNAQDAGAEAVVIFNQGNPSETEDRSALLTNGDATNGGTVQVRVPVVGASFATGEALAQAGSTASIEVLADETRTDHNVIAELPGRNPDNVVMAGAHLDSVTEGPGINDDGSGTAALLETALLMAKSKPENTLRFGFWAAEELGLIGSTDYVTGLSEAELRRIALYLNFDMVGSPNHVQTVYDADESTFTAPVPIPPGSTAIEDLLESWYTSVDEPYDDSEFNGRSDYQAFIEAEIPSGGLFTGAEGVKTAEQAEIWGGTPGEWFDPCYHAACDTYGNVDLHALGVNSDLIAYAMLTYAHSTESVNGVPGRAVPGDPAPLPAPAGPRGTFTTPPE